MRLLKGVLLALCLVPVVAGSALGVAAWQRRTVKTARQGSMSLKLERAGFIHHGGAQLAMPMPGMAAQMPAEGHHRLSVEVTVHNGSVQPVTFHDSEIGLYLESGERVDVPRSDGHTTLAPNHLFTAVLELEVAEREEPLLLAWTHDGGPRRRLMTLQTPISPSKAAQTVEAWPPQVDALPPANPHAGAELFHGPLGCVACHGSLAEPASATVGPPLLELSKRLANRGVTSGVAQYVYDSLIDPDATVAPECAHGRPCAEPSVMPPYGERLTQQQMADLVAFLVSPTAAKQE